jgi:hypothetical protein
MPGSVDDEYIDVNLGAEALYPDLLDLEEFFKTPADKYGYVIKYFENAYDNDLDELHTKLLMGRGKNSIKQVIHKSRLVNKLKNERLADVPTEFYERLEDFVEDFSADKRAPMVAIIKRYKNFKEEHGDDSMFIKILYRLLPDSFIKFRELEGMRGGGTAIKTSEGHKFSINSSRKNWTANKKYKKWVTKLTRKQRPNKKSEDLCVGSNSICKGDLGIPRKYMPQFDSPAEIRKFTRFVNRVYKIKSFKKTRKARQLKPSQGEINKKRIQGLIDEGVLDKVNIPLVVSEDNYVVDGHHRWAAYRLKKPNTPLPVMVIEAPIKDVLGIAVAWGAKHHEF